MHVTNNLFSDKFYNYWKEIQKFNNGGRLLSKVLLFFYRCRIEGPPSVCPNFVSGAELWNLWTDFFDFVHTYPLGV